MGYKLRLEISKVINATLFIKYHAQAQSRPVSSIHYYAQYLMLALSNSLANRDSLLILRRVVHKVGVDVELLLIEMREGEPESNGGHGSAHSWSSEGPDEVWILDGWGAGEGDEGGDGGHEQVDSGHRT